jgi:hypothetical protein
MTEIAEIFESMEYGPAPESPERAVEWLEARGRRFGLYIAGGWEGGSTGEVFPTRNPSSGERLADVTQASDEDVDRAVAAARAAAESWRELGGPARARHLYAVARALQKNARLFAVLESMDNGKPIRESRDLDIPLVARHFYHHAGWAQLMDRELRGYRPVGVVGQIIPWNFPLLMLAWKIAPALATGNTVVLKPAEFTPLTALRFAELCGEVGLPPGVVNIVTGDGTTGAALVAHPDVDKIASWEASRPSSCTRMQTWTAWSRGWWTPSGSTRARCAVPVPGSWCRRAWQRRSRRSFARGWRSSAWAIRWTRGSTWGPSSLPCSSKRFRIWWPGDGRRGRASGSRPGASRRRGGSTRPPSVPTWRPRRPSLESRSSARSS